MGLSFDKVGEKGALRNNIQMQKKSFRLKSLTLIESSFTLPFKMSKTFTQEAAVCVGEMYGLSHKPLDDYEHAAPF